MINNLHTFHPSLPSPLHYIFLSYVLARRFSLANSVYKSLQDNNEDQTIICLGESASGKSENCRMIIKFLSNISGNRMHLLQRQRSSNSIGSYKNSPKSNCSTPKHKAITSSTLQKSSCIKTQDGMTKSKKMSRVEFDFSYQKHDIVRFCPKHNCCTQQNASSSSSTTSTSNAPIDIPQIPPKAFDDTPAVSKSFSIYETMNRDHHRSSLPNCHSKSLANVTPSLSSNCSSSIKSSSEQSKLTQVECETSTRNNDINLDNFKSAKRKVPIKNFTQHSLIEIQAMKEKIAQAEIFLEAMGNASTTRNRDSSRYVCIQNFIDISIIFQFSFLSLNSGQIYWFGNWLSRRHHWRPHYALWVSKIHFRYIIFKFLTNVSIIAPQHY